MRARQRRAAQVAGDEWRPAAAGAWRWRAVQVADDEEGSAGEGGAGSGWCRGSPAARGGRRRVEAAGGGRVEAGGGFGQPDGVGSVPSTLVLSEMRSSWGRRRGRRRFKCTDLSVRLVAPTGTKGSFGLVGGTNRDQRPTL